MVWLQDSYVKGFPHCNPAGLGLDEEKAGLQNTWQYFTVSIVKLKLCMGLTLGFKLSVRTLKGDL